MQFYQQAVSDNLEKYQQEMAESGISDCFVLVLCLPYVFGELPPSYVKYSYALAMNIIKYKINLFAVIHRAPFLHIQIENQIITVNSSAKKFMPE